MSHDAVVLPGWTDAVKRRVLDALAAQLGCRTPHVAALARGDAPTSNRYFDLLWVLVDASDVDVGIDPVTADYDDAVVDTDPTARLLAGLPAGSLGPPHDPIPGFGVTGELSRGRVADLVEAALFELEDPRAALIRIWAAAVDASLDTLHDYGRGVATDAPVDEADRTRPRRFGIEPSSQVTTGATLEVYLWPPSPPDGLAGRRARITVLTDGERASLVLDDAPDESAVAEALAQVGDGDGHDLAVETVVLRGSEPDDHPTLVTRPDYRPRDTLRALVDSDVIDVADTDVVLADAQAARENVAALARQVDQGNQLYVFRGRFVDDAPIAAALDRVAARAGRDAAAATRCWKRDAVATLGGRAAVQFAAGFRPDDPDGRRALGIVADEASLLLPGDTTAADVVFDSGRDWDVVDLRGTRASGLARSGERPTEARTDGPDTPLADATPIVDRETAAPAPPGAVVAGSAPLVVTLGVDAQVDPASTGAGRR